MTEDDFARIEAQLGIVLPLEYRQIMATEGPTLVSLALDYEQKIDDLEPVFLTTEHLVDYNQAMRRLDYYVAEVFPEWWNTYFMVGTNGGGDFYCLRLDGRPGVWMIGSDCGEEPTLTHESFRQLVSERLEWFPQEMTNPELVASLSLVGSKEDWAALREAFPDSPDLGNDYRAFDKAERAAFEQRRNQLQAQGKKPMHVFIRARPFVEWCEANGGSPDLASREAFAAERLLIENPWVRKYRERVSGVGKNKTPGPI